MESRFPLQLLSLFKTIKLYKGARTAGALFVRPPVTHMAERMVVREYGGKDSN